ncbi:hypothetical protein HBN50_09715 [Halobacteriovorax sp. GB3]|uniref:hypothetical protein n=1 Tax=Halobacteriovorax sp. GB3 TaxID=2719615 RepID=UPI00235E93B8|nr:hypothetical protein [Halobacteriovorax sp. GB3]MDD0853375.1 hypothetical protein [Halobacteriovorax sp. GB3]
MNKVWFVVENNQMLGPLDRSHVLALLSEGELRGESLLKKKGHDELFRVDTLEEFEEFFSLPDLPIQPEVLPELPELPPLPPVDLNESEEFELNDSDDIYEIDEDEISDVSQEDVPPIDQPPLDIPEVTTVPENVELEHEEVVSKVDEIPDELADEYIEEYEELPELETELDESEDLLEEQPIKDFRKFSHSSVVLVIVGVSVMLSALGIAYFFTKPKLVNNEPTNIVVTQLRQLQKVAYAKPTPLQFDLALNRESSLIWMASNLKGLFEVQVEFKSIKGKTLSDSETIFSARGTLNEHFGSLTDFRYEKGIKIDHGEYAVTILYRPMGLKSKLDSKGQEIPFKTYKRNSLLYPKEAQEFLSKLEERKKAKKKAIIDPLNQRLELYKTLRSFTMRSRDSYFRLLDKALNGASVDEFEQEYHQYIGPLYNGIVIKINQRVKLNDSETGFYEDLFTSYKEYGSLVSDMVTSTRSKRWLRKNVKKKLRDVFERKISTFLEEIDAQIKSLEDLISKAQ